jgi:O-antigen/teichoic acid export membrane protein
MNETQRRRPAEFLRGLGLGTAQTLVRLCFGFASIKVTAVYLGPSGLALIAQLLNMINLCQGVASNGALTAVLRLGAEYRHEPARRREFLSTALQLALGLTALFVVGLLVTMPWTMKWIFAGQSNSVAYVISSVAILCGSAAIVIIGALNSAGEMGRVTVIQIIITIIGFCIFVPSSYFFGIQGALIATALTPLISFAIPALMVGGKSSIEWLDFQVKGRSEALRRILDFYPMLLVHAGAGLLMLLMVRDLAIRHLGLEATGIWQATWRLSEQYLTVLTTSVSLYFMPKLGSLVSSPGALRREVLGTLWRVTGVTLAAATLLFVAREWVVRIVFAPTFHAVTDLMPLQLLGDVFKMGAWILAMTMTTLLRTRWYIACEILVPITFLAVASLLVDRYGAHAMTLGYAASGLLHLSMGTYALRDIIFTRRTEFVDSDQGKST